MTNDRRAIALGLGAVALWSTVATAFKLSLNHLSPLALVTLASALSWLFFVLLLTLTQRWPELRSLTGRDKLTGLLIGWLNPGLYYLVLFAAYERLPAQEAMALNYTWALTLPLLAAPLLRQSIAPREMLAALISYLGVFCIATRGQVTELAFANPAGIGLALGSTVIWALYWIANTRQSAEPVMGLFLNFSGALPVLLLVCGLTGELTTLSALPTEGMLGAGYVGLFEMGVSFILWLSAMRLSSSTVKISTLIFLAPPVSLLLIWLVLGETIMASTLVGLVLILVGLSFQHLRPR